MECKIVFYETRYDENTRLEYPIARCDDIFLHFNHSTNFEEPYQKWEERKLRIKWDDLFVMFYSEDQSMVDAFCELPFEKKFALHHFILIKKTSFI